MLRVLHFYVSVQWVYRMYINIHSLVFICISFTCLCYSGWLLVFLLFLLSDPWSKHVLCIGIIIFWDFAINNGGLSCSPIWTFFLAYAYVILGDFCYYKIQRLSISSVQVKHKVSVYAMNIIYNQHGFLETQTRKISHAPVIKHQSQHCYVSAISSVCAKSGIKIFIVSYWINNGCHALEIKFNYATWEKVHWKETSL